MKTTNENKPIFELLNQLNIEPQSISIYQEALTHASYANDKHLKYNYEKLEFLGDAVINLVVANYLYHHRSQLKVGELSKLRTMIVQSKSEVLAAQKLNLQKYMLIGNSFNKTSDLKKVLEDGYEALIGAIYLDQGYPTAQNIVVKQLCENSDLLKNYQSLMDYKSVFQELTMKYGKHEIQYKTTKNSNNTFTSKLYCNNICYGVGTGNRIKSAEQSAAKEACDKFSKEIKNLLQ